MIKKKYSAPFIVLLAATIYFVFFYKDKTLKFVPKNADAVVLVDVKKLTGKYLYTLAVHPSAWTFYKTKRKGSASLKDSGIKIPDFLQVFHLKGSKFSEWYTVLELKDQKKLITFLKKHQFISKGKNLFQKDQVYLIIEDGHCIFGTSNSAFTTIRQQLLQASEKNTFHADRFIQGTDGSISFISGQKIQNFSVELKDDGIEISNHSKSENLNSLALKLQQGSHFLEMELDAENIKNAGLFFSKSRADLSQINYFRATADLEQVSDTIVSYGYDDDFNEIEKKTVQKIIQPNYIIDLQSRAPGKTWDYFQAKKWINTRNQFTAIPFQPNTISLSAGGIVIKSIRKPIPLSAKQNENYIFIRNIPMLSSSLSALSETEKRLISDIEYILYGNKAQNYWVKVKTRNGKLPLILRR
ncbi:MAG: hypothetical protein MUW56_10975 [Chryseobacterium sp.]|uniref:hypothetical protein n=1 Tax=Chryseobacterium sp. TaxID=1871047 RepID=UPI0025BF540D|nr:hypothetical protein [Chryseobacterium sp.]MCJ7934133.1 hypothetical protein [Chryseobacterium sp.]